MFENTRFFHHMCIFLVFVYISTFWYFFNHLWAGTLLTILKNVTKLNKPCYVIQ